MGNTESSASVRIANQTELPLVYVIKQVGPLYWGVIQPGERVTRHTGRVWFTVETYPYDGSNEPTTWQAVKGPLLISLASIAVVATGGAAAVAATPASGTAAAALAPLVSSPVVIGIEAAASAAAAYGAAAATANTISETVLERELIRTCNHVSKSGHYANGDWIHVRGGPKRDVHCLDWEPMCFES